MFSGNQDADAELAHRANAAGVIHLTPAGHMLHQKPERAALAEKMPNLRVVIRDRAHSSRHLNEHSFAADPVLQLLLHTLVLRQHSIARQLKDSQPLRAVFVAETENQLHRDDLIATVTDADQGMYI